MRHWIGAIAGLLLTPVLFAGLTYGAGRAVRGWSLHYLPWIGLSALLATAVVAGILAGSRISPLASLVPGLALLVVGVMHQLSVLVGGLPVAELERALPTDLRNGYLATARSGMIVLVGALLVVASTAPARWRKAPVAAPPYRPEAGERARSEGAEREQPTRPFHRE
ncbi:hypothetical protein [Nonomuraea sp. NPDC050310]|uniref:hypothetical protein n=1 Tax=unclassified Nonomuraea TaxID=2593643 RepID=UPI0034065B8F